MAAHGGLCVVVCALCMDRSMGGGGGGGGGGLAQEVKAKD